MWEDGQVCVIVARPLVGGVVRIYESGYSVRRSSPAMWRCCSRTSCVCVYLLQSVWRPRERVPFSVRVVLE